MSCPPAKARAEQPDAILLDVMVETNTTLVNGIVVEAGRVAAALREL